MIPAEKGVCSLKTVLEGDLRNTAEDTNALLL